MTPTATGEWQCAQGAALSRRVTERLAHAIADSAGFEQGAERAIGDSSTWFCPRCGLPLTLTGPSIGCCACGLNLTPLVHELVEFSPHVPTPITPDRVRVELELHDSVLQSLDLAGLSIDGYVHRWVLRAGVWVGTGWRQRFQIDFARLQDAPVLPSLSVKLVGGRLDIANVAHENMIPYPLQETGAAQLSLDVEDGRRLDLSGVLHSLRPVGDASLVESLPSDFAPVA